MLIIVYQKILSLTVKSLLHYGIFNIVLDGYEGGFIHFIYTEEFENGEKKNQCRICVHIT